MRFQVLDKCCSTEAAAQVRILPGKRQGRGTPGIPAELDLPTGPPIPLELPGVRGACGSELDPAVRRTGRLEAIASRVEEGIATPTT